MRRAPLAWIVASTTIAVSACNALSGLDEDYVLDRGTTVPEDGGSGSDGEGGSVAQDGSIADGDAPDTSVPDAGILDCTPPLPQGWLFCDAFEDTSAQAPAFGWTRSNNTGGTPTVVAVTTPDTRHLRAAATSPGGSAAVALWETVQTGFTDGTTLTLSLRLRVKSAGIDYAVAGAIQLNALEYGVAVYKSGMCPGGSGVCLDQNETGPSHTFDSAIPLTLDRWYQVTISVRRAGNAYAGKVIVDGTTLDDRPSGAVPAGTPSNVEVGVGAFFTGSTSTTETNIDDVVVTRSP